jgi:hypothetical protein
MAACWIRTMSEGALDMRTLVTFFIAAGGLVAMFAGPLVLLPVAGAVDVEYGQPWGYVALGGVFAVCAAMLVVLSRIADRRVAHLDPGRGPPPRDRVFCQGCGALARVDEVVCRVCGGTRFSVAAPASGPPTSAARPVRIWPRYGRAASGGVVKPPRQAR